MAIKAGDYRLRVSGPCRLSWDNALETLESQGLLDKFRAGFGEVVGRIAQGKVSHLRKLASPDEFACTVEGYRLRLQVDDWRMVIRVIQMQSVRSPLA